ncbi:PAS domain S-box/diguanylate cyclase (GGDEF) domain-containing protein [Sphaerochaeta pleomorpha str. Grapes]|uniref:PAS domain S-box/diguanylate cyclase (GGDEF) domain-containing protein n=1 Tax=Sphaerochaeta pleomorpha (strain ATCC BAA-1885 / DSM 22778 / Grapes) TaxID=158190 RepID=G8QVQ4_SPHPG|nr:GGDEF domain-containing protein [Sphaerochaeta pleomorpha]AEV29346.1 PAS domain S-box/diguanylate cyclase (GGDEF) domain-containing protein [Sphaerochaeta pleomorpha str. Grapes]
MRGEELYSVILGNIHEGVYFVDTERKITFWNKGAERITGYLETEVLGKFCYENILKHVNQQGIHLCLQGCPLHQTLIDGQDREALVYLHHKNGHRVSVKVKTIPMCEGDTIVGAVELFNDNSEREELENNLENLKVLAMKDQLTNLANRRYTEIFLNSKMQELDKLGIPFGIVFMDIDRFKVFNDTYGHEIGDAVLKMVSKTIGGSLRSTDLIGRWGGEEFIAIFSGVDEKQLWDLSEKMRMLVENSTLDVEGESLYVSISLGATVVVEPSDLDSVVKRADDLMYESKAKGRNRTSIG